MVMNDNDEVRIARSSDVETSAAIIDEVAEWGDAEGFPSFGAGGYAGPESRGAGYLRDDIAANGLYLVWQGDTAVATFSLLEQDPMFWPNAGDDALYLHRFAVRRSAAGIGRHAVAWCFEEARRRERSCVRLDCLADNPGIRRYYERFGFVVIEERMINGTHYALYEVRL
jgi:GNAT superfamily N-acetyltransferase